MIFAMTLANSGSILTAEDNSGAGQGFSTLGAGYGALTRSPVSVRSAGSEIILLADALGDLNLFLSGDQVSFLTGKTLHIDGTSRAISTATTGPTYSAAQDRTQVEWVNDTAFTVGETYIIRIE